MGVLTRIQEEFHQQVFSSYSYFQALVNENPSDANLYGLALALSTNNQSEESIKYINTLINKYPKNLFLNTSKVEILTEGKNYKDALFVANTFLEIAPKNYPLTIAKSKLLLEMGEYLESEEIIRDQLLRRNEDPQLWLLLSEIQRNSKNIIGYHQSRAEYFLLLGQNEEALSQLEFALSLTKNNFQVSERIMNQIVNIKKEIGESRGF